jgi:hypothetical protein
MQKRLAPFQWAGSGINRPSNDSGHLLAPVVESFVRLRSGDAMQGIEDSISKTPTIRIVDSNESEKSRRANDVSRRVVSSCDH